MAETKKVYWDTCVWLALINEEVAKLARIQHVLAQARAGTVQIWTSTLTLGEVFKKTCEGKGVSLPENKDAEFERYVEQSFFVLAQVDYDVGVMARRLLRQHPKLKKVNDGIHLATAVIYDIDELHTFDEENLIPLNGAVNRADGTSLLICLPPEPPPVPVQQPLPLFGDAPAEPTTSDAAKREPAVPDSTPGEVPPAVVVEQPKHEPPVAAAESPVEAQAKPAA